MKVIIRKIAGKLYNFFIELLAIPFGHYRYEKFVIICQSRTGSNMLMSILQNHPNIKVYGEKFRRLNGQTSRGTWNEIFSKKIFWIKSVGFKIFYYHPLDDGKNEVWDLIRNDKKVKIVHLKRKNMFRTFVSRKIANGLNRWVLRSRENKLPLEAKRIKIDPQECVKSFEQQIKWQEETAVTFSSHPYLEIFYESMLENEQIERLFDFLKVPSIEAKSKTVRQNPEPLMDLVENYHQVHKALTSHGYSNLLEDPTDSQHKSVL